MQKSVYFFLILSVFCCAISLGLALEGLHIGYTWIVIVCLIIFVVCACVFIEMKAFCEQCMLREETLEKAIKVMAVLSVAVSSLGFIYNLFFWVGTGFIFSSWSLYRILEKQLNTAQN